MFYKSFTRNVVRSMVILLHLQGAACFFVKHVKTGKCINDTAKVIYKGSSWGNESDLELVDNCLDSASQFRFRDNGAMLNLKRQGCLNGRYRDRGPTNKALDMFYLYVDHVSLDRYSCAQNSTTKIYRAITQTSAGGLSQYYRRNSHNPFKAWCIEPKTYSGLADIGLDPYIGATTPCDSSQNQIFHFGVVTCYGNKVENANCPKDQTMVVKTASYRGLPDSKTCGLSDDYTCEVDVTCLIKKHCDGQHECNITVNDSSIAVDACPELSKYLYFEYRCVDKSTPFKDICAPSGAPRNIKTTSRSTSTLTLTWDAPEKSKQNGVIVSYTVCVSHSDNGSCFATLITSETKRVVGSLKPATKYFVRVLASNIAGSSMYSRSEGFFTNGRAAEKASSGTSTTLTFSLEIPSEPFQYFYVVALKLTEGEHPSKTPDSYRNDELVTYAQAKASTIPKPFVAAVVRASGTKGTYMFILGDSSNTSTPTTRQRRSASGDYHNGPLEPGTSYSIFQRIFINDQGDYYSTEWSATSKTEEYSGGPRVLTNMSSGEVKAKKGDLVNLLCSAQGDPPITFTWEKDQKPLKSFMEGDEPYRSSLLVLQLEDDESFGKYICHVQDRFQTTSHEIWVRKDTGEDREDCEQNLTGIIILVILLVISLIVVVYLVYRQRTSSTKTKLESKAKSGNNSRDIYDLPEKPKSNTDDVNNYEEVGNMAEQANYSSLNKSLSEDDDHLYCHLDKVQSDHGNENETPEI